MPNLTRIDFVAGPRPDDPPLSIEVGQILVLIGPNNSGKSLTLREIENSVKGSRDRAVINKLDASFPADFDTAFDLLRPFITTERPEREEVDRYKINISNIDGGGQSYNIKNQQLKRALENQKESRLASWLLAPYTIRLDGRSRFDLVKPQTIGDLRQQPTNHLWRLFNDTDSRERVRELTEEAFGLHFVLAPLKTGRLSIHLSSEPPPKELKEATITLDYKSYLDNADSIRNFGDGVQAFVGILSALHSLQHKLILLDEPEAFLHPPLIRRLGGEAASVAEDADATLVVATHSADFLLGCLGRTTSIDVVRLTYQDGTATASHLDAERIRSLLHDPLLRSTGLASGLFHQACVVTEGGSDRVFYEEMNRRLLADERGIGDVRFLNAENWQTVARLVHALRGVGVPAAAILDLDTVTRGTSNWEKFYRGLGIPKNQWTRVNRLREKVTSAFDSLSPDPGRKKKIKRIGLDALSDDDKDEAEELVNYLARYGLFLVPVGEVESWFGKLKVGGRKSEWLSRLFDKIGTFKDDPNYKCAGEGDVWEFLEEIQGWVEDSSRDGMDPHPLEGE